MATLASSKLFSGLPGEDLEALGHAAQELRYQAAQSIFKTGDPGDGVYVIKEGEVELSGNLGRHAQHVLWRMGAGDFFGELAVLDDQARSAHATAVRDSTVFFIPRDKILEVLNRSPKLSMRLLREISFRLRQVNEDHLREVLQAERLSIVGRFAQSIIHDLKNPLTVIGLSADLAIRDQQLSDMTRRKLRLMRKQVDRIDDLVGDVLEFTRGAPPNTSPRRIAYGKLVEMVVGTLQEEAALKSTTIELEAPAPAVEVFCEPKRISRGLVNLVNNASDFLSEGGSVTVRISAQDRDVITEVADTGPGIAPEAFDRLFEPFTTYGKVHGTGLGLSICRRIVEDHGGWIRGANRPEGGAIFTFGLPIAENTQPV